MSHPVQLLTCGLCVVLAIAAIGCHSDQPAAAQPQQPANAPQQREETTPVDAKGEPSAEAEPSPYIELAPSTSVNRAAEEKIRQGLSKKVTVDFQKVPLEKVVAELGEKGGIQMRLDREALAEEGIGPDEPIALALPMPIRLRSTMKFALEPLGLAWFQRGNEVVVTTEIVVEDTLETRYYSIRGLLDLGFQAKGLEQFIQNEMNGSWWEIDGTGGDVLAFSGALAVRQTERVQQEIAEMLRTLERVGRSGEKSGFAPLYGENDAAHNALHRKVSLSLDNVPLSELAANLSRIVGVNVILERAALIEEGIGPEEAVSIDGQDIPLQTALAKVFEPLELTVMPLDGALVITTEIFAEERLEMLLYNIRDFAEAGYEPHSIIELLEWGTYGPWLEIDGTGGTMTPLQPGFLAVRQTTKNHLEAAEIVGEFRRILAEKSQDGKLPQAPPAEMDIQYYKMTGTVVPLLGIEVGLRPEHVRDAVLKFVAPESWKANGGEGEISIVKSMLVVRQTGRVHREINKFLETLRWGDSTPDLHYYGPGVVPGLWGLPSGWFGPPPRGSFSSP